MNVWETERKVHLCGQLGELLVAGHRFPPPQTPRAEALGGPRVPPGVEEVM